MLDWKHNHFGKYGLDADIEALCFYLDGDYIIYELDTDSVLYSGISTYKHKVGSFVVSFANLIATAGAEIKSIVAEATRAFPEKNAKEYTFLYDGFCKVVDPIIAIAITQQYFASSSKKDFWLFLDTAIQQCTSFIDNGRMYLLNNAKFEANIVPCNNENGTITNKLFFCTHGFSDVISFDVYKASELNILIKRCALCGKAFIPVMRSDEIYCHNPYRNGRTCSDIAFEIKSKRDPFYTAYRNAYKTESARATRMVGGGKDRIKRWREQAKSKLHEYKSLDDINGFEEWLQNNRL